MKKNETYGLIMPESQQPRYKLVNHATVVITDFLYPNTVRPRYPLTRCLLMSLIEYVRLNKDKKEHTFRAVINILSDVLEYMNNGKTEDEKLSGFKKYFDPEGKNFYNSDGYQKCSSIQMPNWVWRAYDLFYNYSKIDSQHYTVACLLYDLIPFADMRFIEFYSAIMHNQKIRDIVTHQEKNAIYQDDKCAILSNRVGKIADRLFSTSEIVKKSIFRAAVLQIVDNRLVEENFFDLNFDIEELKTFLMRVIYESEWNAGIQTYNNQFGDLIKWYTQIAYSSTALSDVTMSVVERILVEEGPINELIDDFTTNTKIGKMFHVAKGDGESFYF